uniref:protein Dr1-like isoform X2 n=1 Tax=Myxine glutinosa TaxID=7769 RepID=UPI00358E68E9
MFGNQTEPKLFSCCRLMMSYHEEKVTVPRATVNKMLREMLPQTRVSAGARRLVLACARKFVRVVAAESNSVCRHLERKIITAEHVIQGLESLGLGTYVPQMRSTLAEHNALTLHRRQARHRLEHLGIPEEELLRQQQELITQARMAEARVQEWSLIQHEAECSENQVCGTSSGADA